MLIIHRIFGLIALVLSVSALSLAAQAAEWSAPLQGGGTVKVDPRTNRATILRNGVETQLWDGVHRLEDGSTLTIHSGQAIPNEGILRSRRLPAEPEPTEVDQWVGAPIVGYSPCERLERRVCGADQACIAAESCDLARQLLAMEVQERRDNDSPNYMTPASGQCQEADQDKALFVTCGREPGTGVNLNAPVETGTQKTSSTCQLLVDKVCGLQSGCAGQTACDAARQLLQMSREAVAGREVPTQSNPTVYQCTQALTDEGFFKRCER